MTLHEVDIAIIGGGMVGASLAALLPSHYKVMVIEAFPLPESTSELPVYRPSYDARSTALSQSSAEIFQEAHVWPLLQQWIQPIKQVHVSDKGYWGSALLSDTKENLPALGYVVENACLGKALLHVIANKPNVSFLCPAKVDSIKPLVDGTELIVRKGDEAQADDIVHAKLAVVADGARSSICQSLGIHIQSHDYGHTAIVANVTTSESHQGIAYERFTDTGPMALLPLLSVDASVHRSALIWTMPHHQAKAILASPEQPFLKALQQRFGYRQGQFLQVGERHAYPLMLSTATEQVRQHIVVLGNAAHSLHPVAGQGFNLALRDVKALCRMIEQGNSAGERLGDLTPLQAYVNYQKTDQTLTTIFSDILPQLFSRRQRIVALGRNAGLVGLEIFPNVKSSFVRFATGYRHGV